MLIRSLTPDDILPASDIAHSFWGDDAARRARRQMGDTFVDASCSPVFYIAEIDGVVVGFAGFRRSFLMRGSWEVAWVAVDKHHHGKDIGHELMEVGLNDIGRRHGALILLMTEIPGFFEQFGFKQIASFNDWILMAMQLQQVKM
jgi:N-acetylglutamate synthase-like GNAT family acetyltransferase